jgi:YggT family protein
MELFGHLLKGLAAVLSVLLKAYELAIIFAAVLSWVSPDPGNPIVRFLRAITEPAFGWLRAKLPFLKLEGFDLSPLAALLIAYFLEVALVGELFSLAARLGA